MIGHDIRVRNALLSADIDASGCSITTRAVPWNHPRWAHHRRTTVTPVETSDELAERIEAALMLLDGTAEVGRQRGDWERNLRPRVWVVWDW